MAHLLSARRHWSLTMAIVAALFAVALIALNDAPAFGEAPPPGAADPSSHTAVLMPLSAGGFHTCAILDDGALRCWGSGVSGQLGYGNTITIGDDETPASAGDVPVGDRVVQVAAGSTHTCALLASASVRCWGSGGQGRLGYGNTITIGDDETPASAGDVPMGDRVVQVAAETSHTCALNSTGSVRCWGQGSFGRLGYGNINHIGDDEDPQPQRET